MPRVFRSLLALACLALLAVSASAAPATTYLAAVRAALQVRADALASASDPASKAKRAALLQAIKNVDKDKSSSLAGDLETLRKIAAKVELAFDPNDPDVRAAIAAVLPVVEKNLDDLQALVAAVFDQKLANELSAAVQEARALVQNAKQPPAGATGIGAVATFLRDAQKILEKARASIAKKDKCTGHGTVKGVVDGAPVVPPFGNANVVRYGGGGYYSVSFSGFFYDRRATDPYHEGEMVLSWGPSFQGATTYTVVESGDVSIQYRDPTGTWWRATSGTITVLSYDEANQKSVGTFSGTLTDDSGTTTKQLTDGKFRLCRFSFASVQ